MKGIQNKIIVSQKAFIIHIYGLHNYKRKLSKFSSGYMTFSTNFDVGYLGGTTNIQTIFDIIPRCLKHVWCYSSYRVPYAGFQVLKVVDLNLVEKVHHITTQRRFKSGDLGGQAICPPLPIHLPAISLSRWFLAWWQKCGGAPSCRKII
jgi:hypothetical protein